MCVCVVAAARMDALQLWTAFVEFGDDEQRLLNALRARIAEPGFVWEHARFRAAVQNTLDVALYGICDSNHARPQQQLRLLEVCLCVRRELYEPWRLRFVESPLPRCASYAERSLWMKAMCAANADPRTLQGLLAHFDADISQADRADWKKTVIPAVSRTIERHEAVLGTVDPHARLHEFREDYVDFLSGNDGNGRRAWPEEGRVLIEDLAVPWVQWALGCLPRITE